MLRSFRACFSSDLLGTKKFFWKRDDKGYEPYIDYLKEKNDTDEIIRLANKRDESYIEFLTFLKENNQKENLSTLVNVGANENDWQNLPRLEDEDSMASLNTLLNNLIAQMQSPSEAQNLPLQESSRPLQFTPRSDLQQNPVASQETQLRARQARQVLL
ncbi:MAG: hypothetical protein JSS07_04025 [Proteobacteria bacterium]|nr:hypothetical protein [Pseudomonadota bacterium]